MISGIAVLCVLVVAGNIHDPGTNLLFVQHVFSMDTITPASAMADHALSIPVLWQIGFWLIVLGRVTHAAILFVLATVEHLRAPEVHSAGLSAREAVCSLPGAGCGFLVWSISAFLAIGGEWFAMWRSHKSAGIASQPAFRILASILLVLIFVAQPDAEL